MGEEDTLQRGREQRLMTLALADQITGVRWGEPALPGGVSLHAMLELSAVRELPTKLIAAYRDVDAFNARSVARYAHISRDDLLASLQGTSARIVSSALAVGGAEWAKRRIPDLAPPREGGSDTPPSRGPSVGGLLRMLAEHERRHCDEMSAALGVTVDMERLRAEITGEAHQSADTDRRAD